MARIADRSTSPRHSRLSLTRPREDEVLYQKRDSGKKQGSFIARSHEDEDDMRYLKRDAARDPDRKLNQQRSSRSRIDEDEVQPQRRDSTRDRDREQRSSVARTREDEDEVPYQRRDSTRDREQRPSIARTRADEEEMQYQRRDSTRDRDREERSSIARTRAEEEEAQYQKRDSTRDRDREQRSSIARRREDDDEVQYQRRDSTREADRKQRSSIPRTHEDDEERYHQSRHPPRSPVARSCEDYDEVQYPRRDSTRDADRKQRPSLSKRREEDESPKSRQSRHLHDGYDEIDHAQPKGLSKHKHRNDDDSVDDDFDNDPRQPACRSPHKKSISHSLSPGKVEDDVDDDNYSDGDTEVQSEDGTWRPITEDDLKGLQCRQQDDSDSADDAGLSHPGRRPSNKDWSCNRRLSDRPRDYDDDRAPKSPIQRNKTHCDSRGKRDSLSSEMNVSLTPRGHHSPRSGCSVHSKKVTFDCRRDQDDIGALKWGFNDDGAYLKRLPNDLSAKFGLCANDVLIEINGKSVYRKSKTEIEECWMDAQEEDDFLRLVLEGDQ